MSAAPTASASCPRCGAGLARGQAWCLECGLAARTTVAPVPPWQRPLAGLLAAATLALLALAVAFALATRDDNPVPGPAVTAPPAAATNAAPVTAP